MYMIKQEIEDVHQAALQVGRGGSLVVPSGFIPAEGRGRHFFPVSVELKGGKIARQWRLDRFGAGERMK